MAKTARGRNLFAIDQAAIEATLAEANKSLLTRRDSLLKKFEKLAESLQTEKEIDEALEFARNAQQLLDEARTARLSDSRPFSDATKTVKDFFQRIEGPIKAGVEELTRRVTAAALRQRRLAADHGDGMKSSPTGPNAPPPPISIARGPSGVSVVAVVEPKANEIPLTWIVEEFDRDAIDLEPLRPYFTDGAIQAACRKHLEANGPHKLKGVSYEQVAVAG